jgi:uncharacterized protein (TIGR03118 family)
LAHRPAPSETSAGWNPGVDGIDPNTGASHATLATDRSNVGAVYTGLAIATNKAGQTFLYAADDGPNRRIDIFDGTFRLVKSFGDPGIPRGFSPYGIQTINGHIWVTYTALNKAQGGFVDIFDAEGNLVKHFAANGPLHSPWGIALAPADFGPMSKAILISNNTSRGRVNAFNPKTTVRFATLTAKLSRSMRFGHCSSARMAVRTAHTTSSSLLGAQTIMQTAYLA